MIEYKDFWDIVYDDRDEKKSKECTPKGGGFGLPLKGAESLLLLLLRPLLPFLLPRTAES